MNKKNIQKINRATVAAVLAASGVAVTVPITVVKAETPFSDLDTYNSHYSSVMNLYNREIISGFQDGTFRPNKAVTRGQAAKMLALTIGVNTDNVKDPGFKDVSKKSSNYKYIAALVEDGVISGFTDKTFRPNEPITRSQMAKILVRGFKFMEATKLTHNFSDVSNKSANRFYIQTLVNLNITTGTSSVTFSPSKEVTRGQLASFLVRAENANVGGVNVKEVTKIETVNGITYAYLNGVRHTIATSLKSIFNATNAEVLKGAFVDGTIVGTDIRSVSTLTINAKGTANNVLKFNGSNSTFRGDVVVTGNYLRFENWNVTGKMTVAEGELMAFSNIFKPLVPKSIASLGNSIGFIDWGKPTNPSEQDSGFGNGANEDLVDIPTDNKNPLPRMSTVNHHIEFVNTTVQQLMILANRTFVKSDKKLPHVTVEGFVSEFEILADMRALYIDTESDTTFYGIADVDTIYKNSYKSVNLYADAITGLIVADNSNGWIDLGDYFYVDKVIIPPNTMPNDVFNDFLNDNDKVGDIEDPDGNDIDRNPIENTIVPDWDPPTLTIKEIQTNLASATITLNSTEDGTVHFLVKKEIDGEPSIREIMQYTGKMGGYMPVLEGTDTNIVIDNLEDQETYIFYAVAVDEAGNVSVKKSEKFEITDATPPNINPFDVTGLPGGQRLEVTMKPDEPGEYFYYYEPVPTLGAYTYTSQEIMDYVANNYRGQTGKGEVDEAGEMSFRITGLSPEINYVVYVVMKDEAGNVMVEPISDMAWTTELDNVYPYVADAELYRLSNDSYEFEVFVNEELDPTTANNLNNYEITGTAILNVDGQPTTIKPDYVEYIAGQKKIKIRVPSATALVNGDTVVVKILPGVTDLAENPFINIDVVETAEEVKNTASYVHNDTLKPTLTIERFQPNPLNTTGVLTYKANKAGTYYYMIIPNSYNMTGMLPRDFYNEFTSQPTLPVDKRIPFLSKQGDNENNTVVVGTQTKNVILPPPTNPFESYSLYMVMKDRSGQLSEIQKLENVIDDSRAPFVQSITVTPLAGSNTATDIKIQASEAGTVFYTRLEKEILDTATNTIIPNPKIAEIKGWHTLLSGKRENHDLINDETVRGYLSQIRSWSNTELQQETITAFPDRNLKPHTDYVYFFAVQDLFGNITMYAENTTTADKTDYLTNQMEVPVYTDGIDPFVNGSILKLTTKQEFNAVPLAVTSGSHGTIGDGYIEHKSQQTFMMTFSEAIKYVGADGTQNTTADTAVLGQLRTAIMRKLNGLTITDMEWQKTSTLGTWNERKLIFTVSTAPTADITINATDLAAFRDLAGRGRTFDIEKTAVQYKARGASLNKIIGALLEEGTEADEKIKPTGSGLYSSPLARITMAINVNTDLMQEYYYVVQNDGAVALQTPEQVVSVVKGVPNSGDGIFQAGSGKVIVNTNTAGGAQGVSFQVQIKTPLGNPRDVFVNNQKVYIVTMDQYGNIVGNSNTNLYELMTRITP